MIAPASKHTVQSERPGSLPAFLLFVTPQLSAAAAARCREAAEAAMPVHH